MDLGLVMGAMCHHSTSSNGNGEVRFCAHCYLHLHAAFLFSTDLSHCYQAMGNRIWVCKTHLSLSLHLVPRGGEGKYPHDCSALPGFHRDVCHGDFMAIMSCLTRQIIQPCEEKGKSNKEMACAWRG